MSGLSGGEFIAEYLIKEGVPYIAGVAGHGNLAFLDALRRRRDQLKLIMVRHEQSAAHLADGYYRVSGRPLACFTTVGPGAVNSLCGVATAFMDSTALVLFTANCPTYMNERGAMQEIERNHWSDFPEVIRPIVKRTWNVTQVEQLADVLPRAFRVATSGRPGPVHIDLPMDVQAATIRAEVPEPEKRKVSSAVGAGPEEIRKAVELLRGAKRPLILAGGGVILSNATSELKRLAELRGIPVVSTFNGKGVMAEDHPLWSYFIGFFGSSCGNKLAQKADVLLAVGCRFAEWTCSSYKKGVTFNIPPTKVIQIDVEAREIAKNYPVEVGVLGDAKTVLAQLAEAMSPYALKDYRRSDYFRETQQLKEKWHAVLRKWQSPPTGKLTTAGFLKELREFLDRDAIVLSDAGHAQDQLWRAFPIYEPRTHISSGGFSTMGFTVPAALGCKLAAPGRQVVGFIGDGSFLMTCQELAAAVQYNLPVVYCVSNNSAWGSIRDMQRHWYGEEGIYGTEFHREGTTEPANTDFVQLGKAFGVYSERIVTRAEVKPALQRAFASKRPALLEVMTDPAYPYAELPTTGWADYPTPEYLHKDMKESKRKGTP